MSGLQARDQEVAKRFIYLVTGMAWSLWIWVLSYNVSSDRLRGALTIIAGIGTWVLPRFITAPWRKS